MYLQQLHNKLLHVYVVQYFIALPENTKKARSDVSAFLQDKAE